MKLKEALERLPRHHLIRIGTNGGSNFIYAGKADNVPWDDLAKKYTCWMNEEEKKAFVRFENREVIDQYPSLRCPAELFIIHGTESPSEKDMDLLMPKGLREISDHGVELLSEAIYKQVVDDLMLRYKDIRKYRSEYLAAVQAATKLERFIREDALMILKEPDALIEMARKEVFGEVMV